ncbi:MAG: hypothetical protein IJW15_04765 [Clostridia bacterium]|nr:hypothetical protein [Clostridia bacterium]
MSAAKNQNLKRQKKLEKRAKIDKATNRFMINLSWGLLAILCLRFVENGFLGSAAASMPTVMKSFAAVFAVVAVALAVCGKYRVFKNTARAFDYSIFALVACLVSLFIGFYAPIRLFLGGFFEGLLSVDSRWWISRGPITLIVIYLVLDFLWIGFKIAKVEHK